MKFRISSEFGAVEQLRYAPHTGVDIPMETGTKLRSIVDGTVARVFDYGDANAGKGVVIRDGEGVEYVFGHLSKITVHTGDTVKAGADIIGLSGNTGHTTGPHLHLGIKVNGEWVDPAPVVKALESVTGPDPLGRFLGSQPLPGGWLDRLNHLSDRLAGKEADLTEAVTHPILTGFKHLAADLGSWTLTNLPDLMGYGAMAAGALIIVDGATGRGMMRPLAYYIIALIISFVLLAG